jgi:hypothetical protein
MQRLLVLCLATVAIALAGTHRITLFQNSRINGTELKAGEYKMEVLGDKIVLQSGKTKVEAPAKMETSDTKYSTNSIRYKNEGGKFEILEIHVGGTKTKVVLN